MAHRKSVQHTSLPNLHISVATEKGNLLSAAGKP